MVKSLKLLGFILALVVVGVDQTLLDNIVLLEEKYWEISKKKIVKSGEELEILGFTLPSVDIGFWKVVYWVLLYWKKYWEKKYKKKRRKNLGSLARLLISLWIN